jgi:pimeloyl-ACP methyl ester carboxylesterase
MGGFGTFSVIISILTFVSTAQADPKYYAYKKLMHERAWNTRRVLEGTANRGATDWIVQTPAVISIPTVDQVLDHFAVSGSALANATFKQRYFVDSASASGPDAPVIYYLCGEAPCDGASNTDLVNTLATKYKAHKIALEHRYYGSSLPFTTLTTDNLQYLSMDQAIEDLAYFQKFIQNKLGLTGKWIVVGGSYAGELAAYYRLKHPELVVGALASSGPVFAKADFFEYDRHVAKVVPAECLAAIKGVVADVETKLQNPTTAAQVKTLFNAQALTNDIDFLYVIADMAATAIQYGFQNEFCGALATPAGLSRPTEAYASEGVKIFTEFQTNALQDSFQGVMDTSTTDSIGRSGSRAWTYQTCTEFGYFQIANTNVVESARSQQITLPYHNEACNRVFGITTPVNTVATNHNFFDQLSNPSVTHIFFTNGEEDPWSNLSLTASSTTASANPNLNFFKISGAAHCDDLGSRQSPELTSARNQSDAYVGQWLSE